MRCLLNQIYSHNNSTTTIIIIIIITIINIIARRCSRDATFSRFDSLQYRRVTDRQTDGQTDTRRQHVYRASIALRGK